MPRSWAYPFQLQQLLLNLLVTAEHALRSRKGKRKLILRAQNRGSRIVAGEGVTFDIDLPVLGERGDSWRSSSVSEGGKISRQRRLTR